VTLNKQSDQHDARIEKILAMGGPEKLTKRREAGQLNARERINLLFDRGSFAEWGIHATSRMEADRHCTPADGKVCGVGTVDGRSAAVVSYDFSVKGASSSPVSNKKMQHMKDLAAHSGMPVVYLAESTGVRMPDIMGAVAMGSGDDSSRFLRRRETPWVSAVFGYAFGSAAWHTVCSDFAVMVKGSVMAVSSPTLVGMATGQDVDREELGGWKLHSEVTGFVDVVVDDDVEALAATRRFLSYLPNHNAEPPPLGEEIVHTEDESIFDILPDRSNAVYDVRKIIRNIVDDDSMMELKSRFARNLVTALCRLNGRPVGIVANNPLYKGGAIDADACDKVVSFLVLCDSYNIPIVYMVDQPGFLVGLNAERKRIAGKVINWINATSLVTVPKVTVIMRKSYGQAFVNMGGACTSDAVAAWYTAEVGFMDPRSGVRIVHGITREDDPQAFDQHLETMSKDSGAYDLASVYGAHDVIDPRETREYLIRTIDVLTPRATRGVGQHLLSNWPTSY
jgi:acetyl-CoA carboxylase carboxyltransferase component